MPVYNGQHFLDQTLENLLTQTFADFELIISDNGSSDQTEQICRRHAQTDPRIRYIRHSTNRGAAFNWNFVATEATTELFKWASDNDYYEPEFLETCVRELLARPDCVLCYTRTQLVTDEGEPLQIDSSDHPVLQDAPVDRFLFLMNRSGRNNAQAGVIRLETLLKTRMERHYPHGDKVLMAELALHGKFWLVDKPLFHRRWGPLTASTKAKNANALAQFIDPARPSPRLNTWVQTWDYAISGIRYPQPAAARFRLCSAIAHRYLHKRRRLARELLQHLLRRDSHNA